MFNPIAATTYVQSVVAMPTTGPKLMGSMANFAVMKFTLGLVTDMKDAKPDQQAGAGDKKFADWSDFEKSEPNNVVADDAEKSGCCCCCCTIEEPVVEPWTATMPQDGRAEVDLGDGYTMELNEHSSEIILKDADGNETRIWGDPHVDVNGERIGDFYDTTTFELENGTKITINTEPWDGNENAYVASQVVVTNGDQGMVIDGISQNDKGDLSITMNENGEMLDFQNDDGLNLYEQDLGEGDYGWTSEFTGERATAEDFALTTHDNKEKRESMEFERDMAQAIEGWLTGGLVGALTEFLSTESGERVIRDTIAEYQPEPDGVYDLLAKTTLNTPF